MTCLSESDCAAIREGLTDTALAWWTEHESKVIELTRAELETIAKTAAQKFNNDKMLPAHVAVQYSVAWRTAHPESWSAWMRRTTDTLRGVARHRAEVRAQLFNALSTAASAILRLVAQVLRRRLGL